MAMGTEQPATDEVTSTTPGLVATGHRKGIDMGNRPPRVGLGAVFGLLLILGVVIQVVKLLVVPLTILAIGAVVTVPIYLVTRNLRHDVKATLPAAPRTPPAPEDDGIISHSEVLRQLPRDIASALTEEQPDEAMHAESPARAETDYAGQPAPSQPPSPLAGAPASGHRHGSCPIKHRSFEAAVRCRNY
jgi:hypothetical protein